MQIRAVVTDLDGTMVGQDGRVSAAIVRAGRDLMNNGIALIAATSAPRVAVAVSRTARTAGNSQLAGRFHRWWQVLGSNQRRRSRRFYRPLPLATRATCQMPPDHGGRRKYSGHRECSRRESSG